MDRSEWQRGKQCGICSPRGKPLWFSLFFKSPALGRTFRKLRRCALRFLPSPAEIQRATVRAHLQPDGINHGAQSERTITRRSPLFPTVKFLPRVFLRPRSIPRHRRDPFRMKFRWKIIPPEFHSRRLRSVYSIRFRIFYP